AANLAVNQTLVRSINTTVIAVLPVAALLFAGGGILHTGPLKDLALALFVGMICGAYSSIFIATPLPAAWKERGTRMIRQRRRVANRRARDAAKERGEELPTRGRRRSGAGTATAVAEPETESDSERPDRERTVGGSRITVAVRDSGQNTGQNA